MQIKVEALRQRKRPVIHVVSILPQISVMV